MSIEARVDKFVLDNANLLSDAGDYYAVRLEKLRDAMLAFVGEDEEEDEEIGLEFAAEWLGDLATLLHTAAGVCHENISLSGELRFKASVIESRIAEATKEWNE